MAAVSLVVPVLADAPEAEALLGGWPPHPDVEMLLVDGGYDARLDALAARRPDVHLIRTSPGRGHQMNVGARAATGRWLLFVHADCRLPTGWLDHLLALPDATVGGWFRFALDDPAWQARWLERAVAWRCRWLRLPYGDQGLFARRDAFAALGGYDEIPLMEDVAFIRRLARTGPTTELPLALRTSSRRWRTDGWWRRSNRNLWLVSLYFLGVSPQWLARRYSGRPTSR
jgi:rSAM/selenodomain-associated transferase 2